MISTLFSQKNRPRDSSVLPTLPINQPNQCATIPTCPHHNFYQQDHYCDKCRFRVCLQCVRGSHSSHLTVQWLDKVNDLKKTLHSDLNKSTKQSKAISTRLKNISNVRNQIEESAKKASTQIRQQVSSTTMQLQRICHRQITEMDQNKRRQISQLKEEESRLNSLHQQRRNYEESVKKLLEQPVSLTFIKTYNKIQPAGLDHNSENPVIHWQQPVFSAPSFETSL